MDEFEYFGLPWVDQSGYTYGIVPVDESPSRQPTATTNQGPSYETPPWIDTINRAIERAAQVATVEVGGYPPYPSYPSYPGYPTSTQTRYPYLQLPLGGQSTLPGVNLSNTTLMLIVGGALLFMLGKRGR